MGCEFLPGLVNGCREYVPASQGLTQPSSVFFLLKLFLTSPWGKFRHGFSKGLASVHLLKATSPCCKPLDWEHAAPTPDSPQQAVWPFLVIFHTGAGFWSMIYIRD